MMAGLGVAGSAREEEEEPELLLVEGEEADPAM